MDTVDRLFELVDLKFKEQKDFANAIQVPAPRVSEWRKRKSASYQKCLPQIAEALGTTTEYLLTGNGLWEDARDYMRYKLEQRRKQQQ